MRSLHGDGPTQELLATGRRSRKEDELLLQDQLWKSEAVLRRKPRQSVVSFDSAYECRVLERWLPAPI